MKNFTAFLMCIFCLFHMINVEADDVIQPWNSNLLTNGDASNQFEGWSKEDGGSGWIVYTENEKNIWASSYAYCSMSQTISLVDKGFSANDLLGNKIFFSGIYKCPWSGGSEVGKADITIKIIDSKDAIIENITVLDTTYRDFDIPWTTCTKMIDIPAEATAVTVVFGGKDSKHWGGQYGSQFTNMDLRVVRDADLNASYSIVCEDSEFGTISTKSTAFPGDTVTISTETNKGYFLDNLKVLNSSNYEVKLLEGNKFIMPFESVTIKGSYVSTENLAIHFGPSENGSLSTDKSVANAGDIVTIILNPNQYFVLNYVQVTDEKGNIIPVDDLKFTMPSYGVTITGYFWKTSNISINYAESQNGSVSTNKTIVASGEEVTIIPFPEQGYQLVDCIVTDEDGTNLVVEDNHFSALHADITILGIFKTLFDIDEVGLAEGFESKDEYSSSVYNPKQRWTLNQTATDYNRTPHNGNRNLTLHYDNKDEFIVLVALTKDESYNFEMYARQDGTNVSDANITVELRSDDLLETTLTIVPKTGLINGDYQCLSGSFTAPKTGIYKLVVIGDIDYFPFYISVDDVLLRNSACNFVTCTSNDDNSGVVSVNKNYVHSGEIVTVTTTPSSNKHLSSLIVKDANNNIIEVTNNEFTMPSSAVTISAIFEDITAIDNVATQNEFGIFPNQSSDVVKLVLGKSLANKVEIFDLSGACVFVKTLCGNSVETLDVSTLTPGLYFVKVGSQTAKLIVK